MTRLSDSFREESIDQWFVYARDNQIYVASIQHAGNHHERGHSYYAERGPTFLDIRLPMICWPRFDPQRNEIQRERRTPNAPKWRPLRLPILQDQPTLSEPCWKAILTTS
jgi:hypothetical protein